MSDQMKDPAAVTESYLSNHFEGCRHPEHVEQALIPILKMAQEEVDFEAGEWEEVFNSLQSRAEFRKASWI